MVLLALVSVAGGTLGSLLGLGGGLVIVPALVVLFGVDIHLATAASLMATIATSSGTAATYVGEGMTDLRVGMFLEPATVLGGRAGALLGVSLRAGHGQVLGVAFVPVVLLVNVLVGLRFEARFLPLGHTPASGPDRAVIVVRQAAPTTERGRG